MRPLTLNFGPWAPDLANAGVMVSAQQDALSIPLADCLNVYYADGEYRSLPTPASINAGATYLNFTANVPIGAFTALDAAGKPVVQVGTASGLYVLANSAAQTMTQIGTGYSGTQWSFCQFGGQMYATDGSPLSTDGLLSWGFGYSPTVTAVTGAPACNTVATVGQFVMVGDLSLRVTGFAIGTGNGTTTTFTATSTNFPIRSGTLYIQVSGGYGGNDTSYGVLTGGGLNGSLSTVSYDTGTISLVFTAAPANGAPIIASFVQAFPNRVQWSAIGNAQNWPVPLTNAAIAAQSGYQDNDADLGRVMAIVGYPLYCLIFQQSGIQRAQYVGGQVVFSFAPYERKRGLVARGAIVQVSNTVYFLAEDGFFMTDGANVIPIGTASDNSGGIDKWFWSNVDLTKLSSITAGYDATMRCVVFSIQTTAATGSAPDMLLLYNPLSGKWTKSATPCSLVWSDSDGTRHKLGLFSQLAGNTGNKYYYQALTGVPATGYLESCDAIFDDGNIRYTIGAIPHIDCADTPLTMIGTRPALSRAVNYSTYAAQDQLTTVAPFLRHGRYTRARVASNNASAINGVTLLQEMGGGM